MSNILGNDMVAQIGIVVDNIEEAGKKWAEFFQVDVPPIIGSGPDEIVKAEVNGERSDASCKMMFFAAQNIQIELIEPDEKPSTWRDDLNKNGEGVHHLAFNIKGMKETIARLEANGIPLLQKGEYTGGRYAYMDSSKTFKTLIELLEND